MLDYSKLFPDGLHCAICAQPRIVKDAHAAMHLERCEAVVDSNRVIPNVGPDASPRVSLGKRRLDPLLRKLVRAELKKQNSGLYRERDRETQ